MYYRNIYLLYFTNVSTRIFLFLRQTAIGTTKVVKPKAVHIYTRNQNNDASKNVLITECVENKTNRTYGKFFYKNFN